jgi:hypothetical protein
VSGLAALVDDITSASTGCLRGTPPASLTSLRRRPLRPRRLRAGRQRARRFSLTLLPQVRTRFATPRGPINGISNRPRH